MNLIICTFGNTIGGMEVFFSGLVKYALAQGYQVYFITNDTENNIYFKLLEGYKKDERFRFIFKSNENIFYLSNADRRRQRKSVFAQIGGLSLVESIGICGYYWELLTLISIFGSRNELRMLLVWAHPLTWTNCLTIFRQAEYNFKKEKWKKQYWYQKRLLKELDEKKANYYTSYAIFDYNNWYYENDMRQRNIEGLPIQTDIGKGFRYNRDPANKVFKVLWVGRFDYFKNDAIEHIYRTLENIGHGHPDMKFIFNIVGHGAPQYEKDIKKRVFSNRVTVNYWGTVQPQNLNAAFSKNDIGIAMGVTVKQMGYAGLPAILIDSLEKGKPMEKNSNWVFDIATGDDGDGLYYAAMGKPLLYRRRLDKLLEEVIENPQLLNEYSQKCSDFVRRHYSYERQNEIVLNRAKQSEFRGSRYKVYRHGAVRMAIHGAVKIFLTRTC